MQYKLRELATLISDRRGTIGSILLTCLLVACGGGGGGGGAASPAPAPTPAPTPGWGTATRIFNGVDDAENLHVAMDTAGNALVVWNVPTSVGGLNVIRTIRYTPAAGWSAIETLSETGNWDAYAPHAGFDASGNAMVVWHQTDTGGGSGNSIIMGRRYIAGTWDLPRVLSSNAAGNGVNARVAVTPAGEAFVVWRQGNGSANDINALRCETTTVTCDAVAVVDADAGNASDQRIAVYDTGIANGLVAYAVWKQNDGTRNNIWANRYANGSWGTAELIENDDAGTASDPQIAVDSLGKATVVWHQSDGTRNNIWAASYNSSGWTDPALVDTDDTAGAINPQIAFGSPTDPFVVWQQGDGTQFNIWTKRSSSGLWSFPTAYTIENNDTGGAENPQLAATPADTVFAVWQQSDGTRFNIWANRYTEGSGWGTAELIEFDDSGEAVSPRVVVDQNGNALAVWLLFEGGRYTVWANTYR